MLNFEIQKKNKNKPFVDRHYLKMAWQRHHLHHYLEAIEDE